MFLPSLLDKADQGSWPVEAALLYSPLRNLDLLTTELARLLT